MKNTQPLLVNDGKNPPACLRLKGRCFPFCGSHQPDSESEGEEEISQENRPIYIYEDSSQELIPDVNQQKAEIVSEDNNVNNELREAHDLIATSIGKDEKKIVEQKLSMQVKKVVNDSIEEIRNNLGIDRNYTDFLTKGTSNLFDFTGSLEKGTKKFGSKFLGIENSDDESVSVEGHSSDKSAELTPRLEADPQKSVTNQRLADESDTQISRVTERPSSEVINPKALTIGDVEPEDPNFSNELKKRAFDYINQVCGFDLNIKEEEKIKYFNISMDMIEEKKAIILESYNSLWKRSAVNLVNIRHGSQISIDDKIKLFDLVNNKINLPAESGDEIQGKMKQFIFVLKALKFKKTEILDGLHRRIRADTERPGSTR